MIKNPQEPLGNLNKIINVHMTSSNEKKPGTERRNALPILHVSGTYYEVGFDVGRTFRGIIQDLVDSSSYLNDVLLPSYNTTKGREGYEKTLHSLEENYPHYVREVRGTSDGARVPFHKLMLLQMNVLIVEAAEEAEANSSSGGSMSCSTICSNYGDQVFLGHTEDSPPEFLNHVYILDVHIKEEEPQGRLKTTEERYVSLCYAGCLSGFCMTYNSHGFAYSMNVIYPQKCFPGKTPRRFLTRALASARNMRDVENILRDTGVGVGDGFSINMIFTKEPGQPVFYNVEIGPSENAAESVLSFQAIPPGQHLFHTNKYQRLTLAIKLLDNPSSDAREKRCSEFQSLKGRDQMLKLLSDQKNTDYSIFRDGSSEVDGYSCTVAVGLFDIVNKTWSLWTQKPIESDPIITLPLRF